MNEQETGRITSVFFGRESHGILSIMLMIDFGGTCQGFGGYALDTYDKVRKRRVGHAAGTDFVLRLLDLFKVEDLQAIKGRVVSVRRGGRGGTIDALIVPAFDGGGRFDVADWREEWFPESDHG